MKTQEPFVGFDVLKRAINIEQVLARYGVLEHLHRSGDQLSGACPIHGGHNRSQFRVSLSKNCFICFGDCHRGGSIVDLVSHMEKVGIRDAALLLQDWFNVRPNTQINGNGNGKNTAPPTNNVHRAQVGEVTENPPLNFTLDRLDAEHPYLMERGLTPETIATFGVGLCQRGWLTGWIAIPVHNAKGELVAYAARWPGKPPDEQPRYRLPKGFRKSLELFNLHRAKTADARLPLVVVEGFFGCMRVWQAGHRRVVSLMGSMLSARQEELIIRTAGPGGRVVLLFDEDEAGRKGRAESAERLGKLLEVRTVRFAREGDQPDSLSDETLLALIEARDE